MEGTIQHQGTRASFSAPFQNKTWSRTLQRTQGKGLDNVILFDIGNLHIFLWTMHTKRRNEIFMMHVSLGMIKSSQKAYQMRICLHMLY